MGEKPESAAVSVPLGMPKPKIVKDEGQVLKSVQPLDTLKPVLPIPSPEAYAAAAMVQGTHPLRYVAERIQHALDAVRDEQREKDAKLAQEAYEEMVYRASRGDLSTGDVEAAFHKLLRGER